MPHEISMSIMPKNFNKNILMRPINFDSTNLHGLDLIIEKKLIELQNGLSLSISLIRYKDINNIKFKEILHKSMESVLLSKGDFGRNICLKAINFMEHDFIVFCYHRTKYTDVCWENFQTKGDNNNFSNIKNNIKYLKKIATRNNLLQSVLSSEFLTLHSIPTVPTVLQSLVSGSMCDTQKRHAIVEKPNKLFFEDKINVDSYNYFEYVHPGYARQIIKLHAFIEKHCLTPFDSIVDVGSGTGSALLLFMELCKNTEIIAVEPSPAAYSYLRNIKSNINGNAVIPINKDLLALSLEKNVQVIMSTGASHHFDTILFLSHVKKLLAYNGILVVADEFISEFSTTVTRKRSLILHHTSYILSIIVERDFYASISEKDRKLVKHIELYIPIAHAFAENNEISKSELLLKNLLSYLHSLNLHDSHISHQYVSFYRLPLLELEALVAGLDYDVEQKTYTNNFEDMAKIAGLSLVDKYQIHATHRKKSKESGTFVFVFRNTTNE